MSPLVLSRTCANKTLLLLWQAYSQTSAVKRCPLPPPLQVWRQLLSLLFWTLVKSSSQLKPFCFSFFKNSYSFPTVPTTEPYFLLPLSCEHITRSNIKLQYSSCVRLSKHGTRVDEDVTVTLQQMYVSGAPATQYCLSLHLCRITCTRHVYKQTDRAGYSSQAATA